jgi:NAD(P)-dependent dehydrogenase (short-subunit alcohol dehydrogenase family)
MISRPNPYSLQGKTILVTGASSGIGRQCAIRSSELGANVIITGRNSLRLQETMELLNSEGDHKMFELNLDDLDSISSAFNQTMFEGMMLNGIIHAAGIEHTSPIIMMKPTHYQNLFNVNVIAGFEIVRIILRKKILMRGASLVFIASIMGKYGQPGKVGYCSSKGALISGVKALSLELAPLLIRANSILPAICNTKMSEELFAKIPEEAKLKIKNMHPLGFGDPDDVAYGAIYLLSDPAKWITGTELILDGGYSAL